ncbi:unnamed protein product [Paramecium primaurelia]|uniref:Uncharacterized protein n=1 Tax=Paramecium primaurelia TaxID=5886 RepID=A0A8S1Q3G4_PARPR|nr:unnamed protein product [Paramecium primaurelia]
MSNHQSEADQKKVKSISDHSLVKSHSQSIKDIELSVYRWAILLLYYLVVLVNGVPYEICVPISSFMAEIYNVSLAVVATASTVFMVMHPILSFVAAQTISNYGWASATNLGVILTILGCAIKLLINQAGFTVLIIGQVLCGIGRPFILNSQASMAMSWFHPKTRIMIITLLNVVNTLSLVVSAQLPGIIFKGYKLNDDTEYEDGKEKMQNLCLLEFYVSLAIVPSLFLLRSRPSQVPVKINKIERKSGMLKIMLRLFKNRNFVLLFIPFSLYFGILKAYLVIMELLMAPYKYETDQVAGVVSFPLIGGLIAQGLLPYFVNKYQIQKPFVRFFLLFSTLSMASLYFALKSSNVVYIYIVITLLAMCVMPILPVIMDMGCDLISPIEPSFAVGAFYMGSMLFFVAFTYILTFITGKNKEDRRVLYTNIFSTIMLIIGFICSLFIKIDDQYYELNVEQDKGSLVHPLEKSESIQKGKGPSVYRGTQSKMSVQYQKGSMFSCSYNNISIVGDVPLIPGEEAEDPIDQEQQE